jgi:hypothetical protein
LKQRVHGELRERVTILKQALEQHQDRGAKLVGIDFEGSKAIGQITSENVSLHAAKAAASSQAKQSGALPPALNGGNPLPPAANVADTTDMKECPECAEMVRKKAKKCRFCEYRFEEA